jgi:hypothetical protein
MHKGLRCLSSTYLFLPLLAGVLRAQTGASLEVNLGPLPVDVYTSVNNGGIIPNCSSQSTVRQCIQEQLASYVSQHVTGLRFIFGISGGYDSTAIDTNGNIQNKWTNNFRLFLEDVKNSGITNITPTPNLGGWRGDYYQTLTVNDACKNSNVSLAFYPALPYGLVPGTYDPADGGDNQAYYCSPANPLFIGWPKIYVLLDSIFGNIRASGLGLTEVDLQNEINLNSFTVYARLIYDLKDRNSRIPIPGDPDDVLGNVRALLSANGFNPGVANYSVAGQDATLPTFDCMNAWGDSSRLEYLSALYAALAGPNSSFGFGPNIWEFYDNALVCDAADFEPSTMVSLPIQYSPPSIIDIHYGGCVVTSPAGAPSGICNDAAPDSQHIAEIGVFYKTVEKFLTSRNLDSVVMFGELFSPALNASAFGQVLPPNIIEDTVEAYFQSGLGEKYPVTLRPWVQTTFSPDYAFPENLGAYPEVLGLRSTPPGALKAPEVR